MTREDRVGLIIGAIALVSWYLTVCVARGGLK